MLRTIRMGALKVSDGCWFVASMIALFVVFIGDNIRGGALRGGIGPAFAAFAFAFIIVSPITFPLVLIAWIIDKTFVLKPLKAELEAKLLAKRRLEMSK
jgi:hypothetical protein